MDDLCGRTIKGYQLQAHLGEGAYGAVYSATQPQVKREVAIKIILPEYANRPGFIRRFETEAQLVAQLEHLHIVPLYDYWREPDGAYLVMRLMKGGSLEDSLRDSGPWEPSEGARLVDQIASALEAAHKQEVVHRDLKPANILLDEDGNAYLSDFGIAKELGAESGMTQTGAIVGTPAYITPEQVQSQPVTPQTDIYSLGVVLYELLVGGHPFPDTLTGELVVKHLSEPLPLVRGIRPDLPPEVDQVIQKATSKDPASRHPDALMLAADFRRALGIEVVLSEVPEAELYNPYKGLRAFQEADTDDFFGREALTGQLIARLALTPTPTLPLEGGESRSEGEGRFLAVVGPSGSGKSSVVKAGLVPALRNGALSGSDRWFNVEMLPGAHPLEELEVALLRVAVNPPESLLNQMKEDERGLLRAVRRALPSEEDELLLVVDQFEEIFTLVEDEAEAAFFMDCLYAAVTAPRSPVRVVITLRADFYDRPLMHPDFSSLMQKHTEVVVPLTLEELEQAIRSPAERVGAVFEQGLVPAITADVLDQPGALPLLQYALTELFERRDGRMLTSEAYRSIGGVLGALGRRAEEVYGGLDKTGKEVARQLFLRLVTLGEGAEDTRRRVLRTELEGLISDQGIGDRGEGVVIADQDSLISNQQSTISNVIDSFGHARLLTFDRDPQTRAPTVEVAHEALLVEWRRLREWLDESQADIRMQRVLGNAAAEWLEANRDPGFLLRGSRLEQFEAWVEGTDLALTADEQAFMDASLEERRVREAAETERQAHEAAMERRSRNFLRGLVAVLAVAAIIALVLSVFAFNQQGIAQENAIQAVQNAATATVAQGQAQFEAATAIVAQEQEAAQRATAQTEAQARATAEADALEQREQALVQASIGLGSQAIVGLESSSPERSVLLALEALEHYPYTWQAERALSQAVLNNRLRLVLNHDGRMQSAAWSADGTKILTGSMDQTVRLWDALNGEELLRITEGAPNIAHWSPDESSILAVNEENLIAKVWDTETGLERFTLDKDDIGGELNININGWEPWSPSGDQFLTYTVSGLITIWDADSGEQLHTLIGHQDGVTQALWSPSGELIASSGYEDGKVILWKTKTGEPLYTLQGGFENERVLVGNWSPQGDQIAIRGMGGAKIYEAATGIERLTLSTPNVWVWRVVWSPDGSYILTSGQEDGTARLWDADSGKELTHISGLVQSFGSAWSPVDDLAAVSGADNIVHLWDVVTGQEVTQLFGTVTWPYHLAFSPEGERLLTMGASHNVNVYDLSEAIVNLSLTTFGNITNAAWSPDVEQIAFGQCTPPDYPVKIWDAATGEEQMTLLGQEGMPDYIAWSPSGDRILTTHEDNTVRIWDAATWEPLLTFTGHEDIVDHWLEGANWSPDGSQIVSVDDGGKVIVWDSDSGNEIVNFSEHLERATCAAWSPNGALILSTGTNGEAIIWEAATGHVLLNLFPEDYNVTVAHGGWTMDGEWVVILSADGFITIFDSRTGEQQSQFFTTSSTSSITDFSLSPSEERILIGGHDGVARVWDLDTGTELIGYEVGGFTFPDYSPDGQYVLIGNTQGNEGSLQVFPTWHSAQELIDYAYECCVYRQLTSEERQLFGLPER